MLHPGYPRGIPLSSPQVRWCKTRRSKQAAKQLKWSIFEGRKMDRIGTMDVSVMYECMMGGRWTELERWM